MAAVAGHPRGLRRYVVKGTFGAGLDALAEQVGRKKLNGSVEVDQVYAHYQHEGLEFNHPDGGQAMYLRDPLFQRSSHYMKHLADEAVTHDGSNLLGAMAENMEGLERPRRDACTSRVR